MTYLPSGLPRPAPRADELDAPYWDGTAAHELRVQRCSDCGTFQWGPEWICHRCRSRNLSWPAVEARGHIFSWERVWHPAHDALGSAVPYVTVLVELRHAGGVRMVGNLLGDALADVIIGTEVAAVFESHEGESPYTLVQWTRTTDTLH